MIENLFKTAKALKSYFNFERSFSKKFNNLKSGFIVLLSLIMYMGFRFFYFPSSLEPNSQTGLIIIEAITSAFFYFFEFFLFLLFYTYFDLFMIKRVEKRFTLRIPLSYNALILINKSIFGMIFYFFFGKYALFTTFAITTYLMKSSMYKSFLNKKQALIFLVPIIIDFFLWNL